MLAIADITGFTLQDYPEHTACIVWFSGCNLRCKYCHNAEFVEAVGDEIRGNFLSIDKVLDFLQKRQGLIDGVVLSGGECTLGGDEFVAFVEQIKKLGFLIKIDTNGLNRSVLEKLIANRLVDFIALDFKATASKFYNVTQRESYAIFEDNLKWLLGQKIDLEIRTTVHTALLQEDDVNEIIDLLDSLGFSGNYYIQNYRDEQKRTLEEMGKQPYILAFDKIKQPQHFSVNYRNFF